MYAPAHTHTSDKPWCLTKNHFSVVEIVLSVMACGNIFFLNFCCCCMLLYAWSINILLLFHIKFIISNYCRAFWGLFDFQCVEIHNICERKNLKRKAKQETSKRANVNLRRNILHNTSFVNSTLKTFPVLNSIFLLNKKYTSSYWSKQLFWRK